MSIRRFIALGAILLLAGCTTLTSSSGVGHASRKLTADDYFEIQQLYANYAQALDLGQGERFANVFVLDGEFTGGRGPGRGDEVRKPTQGHDALLAMGSNGGTRHFVSNLVVTPSADGAKGSCYLLLFNVRTIPATIAETAIYDDTLVKTTQGWKFKKRIVWRDDDDITPYKPKPRPPR